MIKATDLCLSIAGAMAFLVFAGTARGWDSVLTPLLVAALFAVLFLFAREFEKK